MYEVEQRAAAERSKTYWLLANLLLEQPSAASLGELRAALAAADASPVLNALRAEVEACLADARSLTALQVEFTRLLRGVGGPQGPMEPYESLAREGRLFGNATEAVAAAYREAGFADFAPEAGPPDHAATELRFLSLLCFKEMQAWKAEDAAAADAWRARRARFAGDHIAPWFPAYCRSLHDAATRDFYRSVAAMLEEACAADEFI